LQRRMSGLGRKLKQLWAAEPAEVETDSWVLSNSMFLEVINVPVQL